MGFKPGVSGNPAGRPKKLLRRVDEVLHERGIEPIAKVLGLLDQLSKLKPIIGPSPKHLKGASEKRSWQAARRAEHTEARLKQSLEIWLEVLPYVYAQPKELSGQLDLKLLEPFVIHRPGGETVEIGAKEPDDKAV